MFKLFSSPKISDPVLGQLVRSRGYWRGGMAIGPYPNIPIVLAGGRAGPEPGALIAVKEVPAQFQGWRTGIEQALYAHYLPCAEAISAGEMTSRIEPFPTITSPSGIWPHLSIQFLSVERLSGLLTIEFGLRVEWDEEHTLGARFQSGQFAELCGSTIQP